VAARSHAHPANKVHDQPIKLPVMPLMVKLDRVDER
jgi:hypothetical protein